MSPAFTQRVLTLVRMHDQQIAATPKSVRKALQSLNGDVELFETLVGIKLADAIAQSSLNQPRKDLAKSLAIVLEEVLAAA